MRVRWLMLIAAVFALPLVGCGGDKDSSSGSTTVDKDGATTTTAAEQAGDPTSEPPPDATVPETVPDDEFAAVIADINSRLDAAGTDTCKVFEAFGSAAPSPANPAQTEQAVAVIADLLNRLADSAPPDASASADTIRATAAALPAEAEAVGFDPEQVNSLPGLSSQQFGQAVAEIQSAANCTLGGPAGG